MTLMLALVLAAAPTHPWSKFPAGAWAQYQRGDQTAYRQNVLTLSTAGTAAFTTSGTGELKARTGVSTAKVIKHENVTVPAGTFECDVTETSSGAFVIQEWHTPKVPVPVRSRFSTGLEWKLADLTPVTLHVARQKLTAYRYDGLNAAQARLKRWLSPSVPGQLVVEEEFDAAGLIDKSTMLQAFGTKGSPPNEQLAALQEHPWARFPKGAWVSTKGTFNGKETITKTTLTALDKLTYTLNGGHAQALGDLAVAADPTGVFQAGAAVKVGKDEYPCLLFAFKGVDQNKAPVTRLDCVSPFSRLPIYSEHTYTVAGITATDTRQAQDLESPMQLGTRKIGAMKFEERQKLSNGAKSRRDLVLSADVPGWTVSYLSHALEFPKPDVSSATTTVDFGGF